MTPTCTPEQSEAIQQLLEKANLFTDQEGLILRDCVRGLLGETLRTENLTAEEHMILRKAEANGFLAALDKFYDLVTPELYRQLSHGRPDGVDFMWI